jgi:hypothetical protein
MLDFDALRTKIESIVAFVTCIVTTFSVIANVLPKYESMAVSPARFVLKVVTKTVAFLALNWRAHIKGVSTNDNRT